MFSPCRLDVPGRLEFLTLFPKFSYFRCPPIPKSFPHLDAFLGIENPQTVAITFTTELVTVSATAEWSPSVVLPARRTSTNLPVFTFLMFIAQEDQRTSAQKGRQTLGT